jgi:hypothetical protein
MYDPSIFNLCPDTPGVNCFHQYTKEGIGEPLFLTTYLLPPLFFALIFMRKEVFDLWWKIFLPFAALGLLLIALSPAVPTLQLPDRVFISERVVWVLFALSVFAIVTKYIQLAKGVKPKALY